MGIVFTEALVEEAALAWLESLGWSVKNGPAIAPGEVTAERADFGQVVPELIPGEMRVKDAEKFAGGVA